MTKPNVSEQVQKDNDVASMSSPISFPMVLGKVLKSYLYFFSGQMFVVSFFCQMIIRSVSEKWMFNSEARPRAFNSAML